MKVQEQSCTKHKIYLRRKAGEHPNYIIVFIMYTRFTIEGEEAKTKYYTVGTFSSCSFAISLEIAKYQD